jgi:UTP--glucose-1-phosphate uridylyltransferase
MSRVRKAVFPVGGLGTRFLPATKALPKEMLPVWDKPLIQYAVEEALQAGIEQFIFVTGRGKSAIEDHFDEAWELSHSLSTRGKESILNELSGLSLDPGQIVYTRQKEPLGLGHAVWCAREIVGQEPFAVLLADDFIMSQKPCLSQMISAYFEQPGVNMAAVMEVPQEHTERYGILDVISELSAVESKMVPACGLVEKPSPDKAPSQCAVIGRYVLQPDIFDALSSQKAGSGGEIQLTDALSSLIPSVPFPVCCVITSCSNGYEQQSSSLSLCHA